MQEQRVTLIVLSPRWSYSHFACVQFERTALTFAAREGHSDIVLYLLDHGADPNLQNKVSSSRMTRSPLQYSVCGESYSYSMECVQGGVTALMLAAHWGHLDAVKPLLDRGAVPLLRNKVSQKNGCRPLYGGAVRTGTVYCQCSSGSKGGISGQFPLVVVYVYMLCLGTGGLNSFC